MNHLADIITPLNKEEIRSYKIFAERINFENSDQKLLRLFEHIAKGEYDEFDTELVKKLFGKANHNAFYRIKNRLMVDVERSLLSHHFALDGKVEVLNLLILAKIFAFKSKLKQAINYLLKAEKKAIANEHFDLLNTIYDEILIICTQFNEINPEAFIVKQQQNLKRYQSLQQANSIIASLNYKLKQTNFSGKDSEVLRTINKLLKQLSVAKSTYKTPAVQWQIHECIKNELLHKKNFEALEKYLISSFVDFNKQKIFSRTNHHQKIVLLIWIINSAFKNKRLKTVLTYLAVLEKALHEFNDLYYEKYVWAYNQSQMLYFTYTNNLTKAIEKLEAFKNQAIHHDIFNFDFNVNMNLATLYFYAGNNKLANKHIAHLLTKTIYQHLSIEWKMSVCMVEILLQIENNDLEYATKKIADLKRNFSKQLLLPVYEKEKNFLKLLQKIANNINWKKNKTVAEQLDAFVKHYKTFEPGSNEAINYLLWIKSKQNNTAYYQLLLDEMDS